MKTIKHILVLGGMSLVLTAQTYAQEEPEEPTTEPRDRAPRPIVGELVDRISDRLELPDELQSAIDDYQAIQAALREDLAGQIEALENPTREEVRALTDQFKADNEDTLMAQRELAQSIRDEVSAIRMENAPDPADIPEAVLEAREQFREQRAAMVAARQQLREDLAAATTEDERKALIEAFRQQQRENVQDIRELRRSVREQLRDGDDSDRRGGGGG